MIVCLICIMMKIAIHHVDNACLCILLPFWAICIVSIIIVTIVIVSMMLYTLMIKIDFIHSFIS